MTEKEKKITGYITATGRVVSTQEYTDAYVEYFLAPCSSRKLPEVNVVSYFDINVARHQYKPSQKSI